MGSLPRHQCMIYQGSPVEYLPAVCGAILRKLKENYRCLYLNSAPMVAGMRSYLAASGLDVAENTRRGNLVLSSEASHLVNGHFEIECLMATLHQALQQARVDGFAGLWATGDMTWEFGVDRDFSKLLAYEQRLDQFIRENPDMGGICQYHGDTLPRECLHAALVTHPATFVNDTLTRVNPSYLHVDKLAVAPFLHPELDMELASLMHAEGAD